MTSLVLLTLLFSLSRAKVLRSSFNELGQQRTIVYPAFAESVVHTTIELGQTLPEDCMLHMATRNLTATPKQKPFAALSPDWDVCSDATALSFDRAELLDEDTGESNIKLTQTPLREKGYYATRVAICPKPVEEGAAPANPLRARLPRRRPARRLAEVSELVQAAEAGSDEAADSEANEASEPTETESDVPVVTEEPEAAETSEQTDTTESTSNDEATAASEDDAAPKDPTEATASPAAPKPLANASGHTAGSRLSKPIALTLTVRVHGPHGWLSGDRAGMLRFTRVVCGLLTLLAVVWGIIVYQRRRQTFAHQYWISALLIATLLEFVFRAADLTYENNSGDASRLLNFCSIALNALRRTLARILVAFVAAGWGIAHNGVGRKQWTRVLAGGAAYGFIAIANGVMFGRMLTPGQKEWRALLLLSETLLDAVFFYWIFDGLKQTRAFLLHREQEHKLGLFDWLTRILAVLCGFSVLMNIYEGDFITRLWLTRWEQTWFVFTGCWDLCFLVTLAAFCWLWHPNSRTVRYMFYEQFGHSVWPAPDSPSPLSPARKHNIRKIFLDEFNLHSDGPAVDIEAGPVEQTPEPELAQNLSYVYKADSDSPNFSAFDHMESLDPEPL